MSLITTSNYPDYPVRALPMKEAVDIKYITPDKIVLKMCTGRMNYKQ